MMLEPIGREQARDLAERELEKGIYHRDDPSWLERAWERFNEWLRELFQRASDPTAAGNEGGWLSLVIIVVLVVLVAALLFWLMRGRFNTRSRARQALLADEPSTARQHRADAEQFAAAGQWAEAIRERLRAIARDLEERVILNPRPGRTADELADEAGLALPDHAELLLQAARIFDDVWYGDRPGTPEGYAALVELDENLRSAKPRALPQGVPA